MKVPDWLRWPLPLGPLHSATSVLPPRLRGPSQVKMLLTPLLISHWPCSLIRPDYSPCLVCVRHLRAHLTSSTRTLKKLKALVCYSPAPSDPVPSITEVAQGRNATTSEAYSRAISEAHHLPNPDLDTQAGIGLMRHGPSRSRSRRPIARAAQGGS